MELYFAPLEGITGCTYRNLHHRYYGGVKKYYTPFLSPGHESGLGPKELKDVQPEKNAGMTVVPQVMTNRPEDFLKAAEILREYGYREINLNMGCPSGTVAAKKKGSGLLFYPEELDRLLDGIFADKHVLDGETEVSVKTRLGKNSYEEWPLIMDIYNRYPIRELTIHPRIQKDFYKNHPNLEAFGEGLEKSRNPVVYNGDIFTVEAYKKFRRQFPSVQTIMVGRGLVGNPELAEQILEADSGKTEKKGPDMARLRQFHDGLLEEYRMLMSGERNVLFRMKELWFYMIGQFPDSKKAEKKIKKSTRLSEYTAAVDELFSR